MAKNPLPAAALSGALMLAPVSAPACNGNGNCENAPGHNKFQGAPGTSRRCWPACSRGGIRRVLAREASPPSQQNRDRLSLLAPPICGRTAVYQTISNSAPTSVRAFYFRRLFHDIASPWARMRMERQVPY